jgi:hypothetical protein
MLTFFSFVKLRWINTVLKDQEAKICKLSTVSFHHRQFASEKLYKFLLFLTCFPFGKLQTIFCCVNTVFKDKKDKDKSYKLFAVSLLREKINLRAEFLKCLPFCICLVWKTVLKDKKANQVLHCLYYPENLKDFEVLKF